MLVPAFVRPASLPVRLEPVCDLPSPSARPLEEGLRPIGGACAPILGAHACFFISLYLLFASVGQASARTIASLPWTLLTSLLTHRPLLCIEAHCSIFWDLPGDVLAAPESALGLDRCNTSLSLSLGNVNARRRVHIKRWVQGTLVYKNDRRPVRVVLCTLCIIKRR